MCGFVAHSDQGNLLQIGILVVPIGFTVCGSNLLNRRARRHDRTKILTVNLIKGWRITQIVQINVSSHDLTKLHSSFFKIIEKIAHSLPELMLSGAGINAAVWPRDEAAFGRAI